MASFLPAAVLVPVLVAGSIAIFLLRAAFLGISSYFHSAPGPFLARFSRLWYLHQVWRHDWHKTNVQLHRKYGPVVRMYPNTYSIDDPAAMKQIYGQGTPFDIKSEWYLAMSNPDPRWPQNLFTERNPKKHAESRKRIAALYSMSSLVKMEEAVDECSGLFQKRFTEVSKSGDVFNMQHWLQCFAFDAIGLITMSKRFGFLDKCEDTMNLMSATKAFVVNANYIGVYPWTHLPAFKLSALFGKNARSNLQTFTQAQIRDKMASKDPSENENFLSKLLKLHAEGKLNMMEVFGTCASNIGAGSDTTSIALTGILWYLVKSPEALGKLRDEINQKAADGKISDPIKFSEAQNMPYLQAIIREGLRLHPSFACILGREVPKGGAAVAGMYFREGAVVGINPWVAHYNKEVFGNDADNFRPERWLADKETVRRMDGYYIPFGAGSRTCIGRNISHMQISKTVPQIMRRFDFHLDDPEAELETDMGQFVWQTNFFCRATLRKE